MKSSIKIDFIDRGTGIGIEPVIRVELIKSDDPRDTLIQTLFESIHVGDERFLQFNYSNIKPVTIGNYHDLEKTILIFKPEVTMEEIMSHVPENIWLINDEQGKLSISVRGSGHD